jgi:hypothetical protein
MEQMIFWELRKIFRNPMGAWCGRENRSPQKRKRVGRTEAMRGSAMWLHLQETVNFLMGENYLEFPEFFGPMFGNNR